MNEWIKSLVAELRKAEYEKKRKQYEAVRKKRKNQLDTNGTNGTNGTAPKVKKRRNKNSAGQMMNFPPGMMPPQAPDGSYLAMPELPPGAGKIELSFPTFRDGPCEVFEA